MEREVW